MFKVVTTEKVDAEVQKAVDQIPEVKTLGLIGISEDGKQGCSCLIGEVSLRELAILRAQCTILLDRIDSEINSKFNFPLPQSIKDILIKTGNVIEI